MEACCSATSLATGGKWGGLTRPTSMIASGESCAAVPSEWQAVWFGRGDIGYFRCTGQQFSSGNGLHVYGRSRSPCKLVGVVPWLGRLLGRLDAMQVSFTAVECLTHGC